MNLRNLCLIVGLTVFSLPSPAADAPIKLERAHIPTRDIKSIQRGARAFQTYCLVCHSLEYMAHDPIAKAAGITKDKMPDKNQKWWFGAAPPDLTLIARVHSADWLYTYLHVFYKDPSRSIGSNNLLLDNANMPNPFVGIQGEQTLIVRKEDLFSNIHLFTRKKHYYTVLKLHRAGTLPPDEFDKLTKDIVNFLIYASEPKKHAREMLGIWVLAFLAVLFILVYLIKRKYWKNIH